MKPLAECLRGGVEWTCFTFSDPAAACDVGRFPCCSCFWRRPAPLSSPRLKLRMHTFIGRFRQSISPLAGAIQAAEVVVCFFPEEIFDFQLPKNVLHALPEEQSDLLFVPVRWIRRSVRVSNQTERVGTGGTRWCHAVPSVC